MNNKFSLPKWEQIPDIDLYMDQVLVLLNKYTEVFLSEEGEEVITASMLNNYVKQKLLPPPNKKKYNRDHVSVFCIICVLKRVLTITQIKTLLDGLGAEMKTEELYGLFSSLLCDPNDEGLAVSDCEKALFYSVRAFISVITAEKYLTPAPVQEENKE